MTIGGLQDLNGYLQSANWMTTQHKVYNQLSTDIRLEDGVGGVTVTQGFTFTAHHKDIYEKGWKIIRDGGTQMH